ncbi:MAG TPA: hypothetical protein VM938_04905 [Acidimicrobiales bacterium]|nr:hypothetical protein [Acidimicrobiales bacterium]
MTSLDEAIAAVEAAADDAEQRRCIPEPALEALRGLGVNRMLLPAELGGSETPVADVIDTLAAIGAADGSTAWCASIASGSKVFAGYLPRPVAAEVFARPDDGAAGVFAALGTYKEGRLSGRWPFTSNCLHSSWIGMGAFVEGDPVPRLFFLPADQVTVHETWDTSGLCATGSHDVSVDDVAVGLDYSCSFLDGPWAAGDMWRMPLFTVLAPCLVAGLVGVARGAVDQVLAHLPDDPVHLAELAAADSAIQAAHAALVVNAQHITALAAEGIRADRRTQARSMLAVQHACDTAVEVVSTAHRLGGGRAAYSSSRLLRSLRDVHAGRQHVAFSHRHRPVLARILAGSEEMAPPLVI